MTDNHDYIAYTDGGCIQNPGGRGGYGVVLIECATGRMEEHSCGYIATTNNRMEMMAVIVALRHIPAGSTVHLYSDSQLVINCMSGAWAKRKNKDLWEIIEQEMIDRKVTLSWVKGHNGDPMNERCDALATEAMTNGPLLPDFGYVPETDTAVQKNDIHEKNEPFTSKRRIIFDVPEDLNVPYENHAGITVKTDCREAIARLTEESGFAKLASLRTGGTDGWSRVHEAQLPELFHEEIIDFVHSVFGDGDAFMNCMRWYGRGLSLSLAVRKAMADAEIADNMMKKQIRKK